MPYRRAASWSPRALGAGVLIALATSCQANGRAAPADARATPPAAAPAQVVLGPSSKGFAEVTTCDPCTFYPREGSPPYSIRFVVEDFPNGRRAVRELHVTRRDRPGWEQTLPVHHMAPLPPRKSFFIGVADVDSDGDDDLYLATLRGAANTRADYWLFVPPKEELSYLGNYPFFTKDAATASLHTFERGGDGGMIYRKGTYRFIEGALTLVESEEQEQTGRRGVYRRKLFRLEEGKLRLVKTETVKAPPPE
jgi:hypothetical protein